MAAPNSKSPPKHGPEPCPLRLMLGDLQLAEKWTFLIFHGLLEQAMRFNEIKRHVPGISQKVLTQSLRSLERNGLVSREVIDMSPVAVMYTLTTLGKSLRGPMDVLYDWMNGHKNAVVAAQSRYDASRRDQS